MSSDEQKRVDEVSGKVGERLSPLKEKVPPELRKEVEPVVEETAEPPPPEDEYPKEYEEFVEAPEEPPRPRRKKRPWGSIIIVVAIVVVLLAWTLLSPKVMPEVGDTYTDSQSYASWGNYTGHRDIWAGNMTWGVSVSGYAVAAGNREIVVDVLVTKIQEGPGNWFFRGTDIALRNVSVFDEDGTFLGTMSNHTDLGFGVLAKVPVSFDTNGTYDLYVTVKFLVYEVMRIGFFPLEMVNVQKVFLDVPVVVT